MKQLIWCSVFAVGILARAASASGAELGEEVCIKLLEGELQCGIVVVSKIKKPSSAEIYEMFAEAHSDGQAGNPFSVFASNYVEDQCSELSDKECDRLIAYAWERYVLGSGF